MGHFLTLGMGPAPTLVCVEEVCVEISLPTDALELELPESC